MGISIIHAKMKNFIALLSLISMQQIGQCQDLLKLKEKNGFQDIKLGSDIYMYDGFTKSFYNPNEREMFYKYDGSKYNKIGETIVKSVWVKTFDNKIMRIVTHVNRVFIIVF